MTGIWSFQDLVEAPYVRLVSCLELLGAHASDVAVPTGAVVEGIDIRRYVG